MPILLSYYEDAYAAARNSGFEGDIWIHDGWAYSDMVWDGFMPPPQYQNVYIDTHIYHCFGPDEQQPTRLCEISDVIFND